MNAPPRNEYIPSWLDDYPLKLAEFRVFCRISRRQGKGDKGCFESIPSIAKGCFMNPKTVRSAVCFLEAARVISVEKRDGQSSVFKTNPYSSWVPSSLVELVRKELTPTKNNRGTPTPNGTPAENNPTQISPPAPTKNNRGTPTERVRPPLPKEFDEGNPIRESNLRESKEGSPPPTPQGGARGGSVQVMASGIRNPQTTLMVIDSHHSLTPVRHPEEFDYSGQQQQRKSSAPRQMTDADVIALGMEYNRCKPEKWHPFTGGLTVSPARFEAMSYLWEYAGWQLDKAKQVLGQALIYARLDPFYSGQSKGVRGRFFEKRNLNFVLGKGIFEEWTEGFEGIVAEFGGRGIEVSVEKVIATNLPDAQLQKAYGQYQEEQQQQEDPVMQKLRKMGLVA